MSVRYLYGAIVVLSVLFLPGAIIYYIENRKKKRRFAVLKLHEGYCQCCAIDGDEFHACVNRYPAGTLMTCVECKKKYSSVDKG